MPDGTQLCQTIPGASKLAKGTRLCTAFRVAHATALTRACSLPPQAAQPAYMKTNSGRVLEMPKTEEGPTTQQELQELTATYEATVRPPATLLSAQSLLHLRSSWQDAWPCLSICCL
jgi:hypothetical protein